MTIISARHCRQLLGLSAGLWAASLLGAEVPANVEPVVLSPFQVVAKSLELMAYTHRDQGKQVLGYIRVKNVAKGSIADRAGLKIGDQIVAIATWRLEGHPVAELNRDFPATVRDGQPALSLAVRRPWHREEREVILFFPPKPSAKKDPGPSPAATPGN